MFPSLLISLHATSGSLAASPLRSQYHINSLTSLAAYNSCRHLTVSQPGVHRYCCSSPCKAELHTLGAAEPGAWVEQVLLTGEPPLVSLACALLEEVVSHNTDALARLHTTGVYFYALAYCGSNLVELARLCHVSLPTACIAVKHGKQEGPCADPMFNCWLICCWAAEQSHSTYVYFEGL